MVLLSVIAVFVLLLLGAGLHAAATENTAQAPQSFPQPPPVEQQGMFKIASLMHRDGKPDINQLWQLFPEHGESRFTFTDDGRLYAFHVRPDGSGRYRIYIANQIDYRGRATDSHSTHRIDPNGANPFICIKDGYAPRTVPDAAAMALHWAAKTSKYIRDGLPWNS